METTNKENLQNENPVKTDSMDESNIHPNLESRVEKMLAEHPFFAILSRYPSSNILFSSIDEDGMQFGAPTRYGKNISNVPFIKIEAHIQNGVKITLAQFPYGTQEERILLYRCLASTGSICNDMGTEEEAYAQFCRTKNRIDAE